MRIHAWLLSLILIATSGCSPCYVLQAAYEQSKILLNREDIQSVISSPHTSREEQQKLKLVLEVREFAKQQGFNIGNAFTSYYRLKRAAAVWVVSGSRPDAFSLYMWWFPLVGSLPYKGFFTAAAAEREAQALNQQGFETWLRPADAFSTLGWFDDPVFSSTLRHDAVTVVDTILHEATHATVWIAEQTQFNESLANFVGAAATVHFYRARLDQCTPSDSECRQTRSLELKRALRAWERELALGRITEALYAELNELYQSGISSAEKIRARELIFNKHVAPLRSEYPELQILKAVNNAEILQLKLYLTGLNDFHALFLRSGSSWGAFFKKMISLKEQISHTPGQDPFELLKEDQA